MRTFIWMAGFALACSGGTGSTKATDSGSGAVAGTGGDGGDGGGSGGNTFADFINVTDAPTGDFTGFEGGFDAAGAWNDIGTPVTTESISVSGEVRDFETEEPVSDATVEIWYADAVAGAPDSVAGSDAAGAVAGLDIPSCTPVTYK
ncbi:MAG: hypothetical protein VX000_12820, partial [Myxococcota bacterium]|nr:hypothetical protein [Myxococcota bacterium]